MPRKRTPRTRNKAVTDESSSSGILIDVMEENSKSLKNSESNSAMSNDSDESSDSAIQKYILKPASEKVESGLTKPKDAPTNELTSQSSTSVNKAKRSARSPSKKTETFKRVKKTYKTIRRCLVTHCPSKEDGEVQLMYFPMTDRKLCVTWFQLCTKDCLPKDRPVMPSPDATRDTWKRFRVCMLHFSPDDIEKSLYDELLGRPVKLRVKLGALPSLNLKKATNLKKAARKDQEEMARAGLSQEEQEAIKARKALVEEILQEDAKKHTEIKAFHSESIHEECATIRARKMLVEKLLHDDGKKQKEIKVFDRESINEKTVTLKVKAKNKQKMLRKQVKEALWSTQPPTDATPSSDQQFMSLSLASPSKLPPSNDVILLPQVLHLEKDVTSLEQKLKLEENYLNSLIRENRRAIDLEKAKIDFESALADVYTSNSLPLDSSLSQEKQAEALQNQLDRINQEITKHNDKRVQLTEPKSVIEMLRKRIVQDDEVKRKQKSKLEECQKELKIAQKKLLNDEKKVLKATTPKKTKTGIKRRKASDYYANLPSSKEAKTELEENQNVLNLSEGTDSADDETDAAIKSILFSAASLIDNPDMSTTNEEDKPVSFTSNIAEEFSVATACELITQPPQAIKKSKLQQSEYKIELPNIPASVEVIHVSEKEGRVIKLSRTAIKELEAQVANIGSDVFQDVDVPILMEMSIDGQIQTFMLRPAAKRLKSEY